MDNLFVKKTLAPGVYVMVPKHNVPQNCSKQNCDNGMDQEISQFSQMNISKPTLPKSVKTNILKSQ